MAHKVGYPLSGGCRAFQIHDTLYKASGMWDGERQYFAVVRLMSIAPTDDQLQYEGDTRNTIFDIVLCNR